jgi:hypothetical protein
MRHEFHLSYKLLLDAAGLCSFTDQGFLPKKPNHKIFNIYRWHKKVKLARLRGFQRIYEVLFGCLILLDFGEQGFYAAYTRTDTCALFYQPRYTG